MVENYDLIKKFEEIKKSQNSEIVPIQEKSYSFKMIFKSSINVFTL